jgi:hypothetical protein
MPNVADLHKETIQRNGAKQRSTKARKTFNHKDHKGHKVGIQTQKQKPNAAHLATGRLAQSSSPPCAPCDCVPTGQQKKSKKSFNTEVQRN